MNDPAHFPIALYLYFAAGGTTALILFALVMWTWLKARAITSGRLRSGLTWLGIGFSFLLSAQWFACGIGAGPGFLLGDDEATRQPFLATAAAVAGMFCSVLGWISVLLGVRSTHAWLRERATQNGTRPDRHGGLPTAAP